MEQDDTPGALEKRRALAEAFESAKKDFFHPDRKIVPPEELVGIADRMQSQGLPEVVGSVGDVPEDGRTRAARKFAHGVKPEPQKSGNPLNLVKRESERRAAKKDKEKGRG